MKILYLRVSSAHQRTDRQRVNEKDYSHIIEDRCSGAVAFFEREGGREIKRLLESGLVSSVSCLSIDRLGRSLVDVLNTISIFSKHGVCLHFISQGISTLDSDGKENVISNLLIGVLGIFSQQEREQIRERQIQGIRLAVARGVYKGRKRDTKEDVLKFLSKPKNSKALAYLKRGLSCTEAAELTGLSLNTLTKIKRVGLKSPSTISL